jgi:hypothetical protein
MYANMGVEGPSRALGDAPQRMMERRASTSSMGSSSLTSPKDAPEGSSELRARTLYRGPSWQQVSCISCYCFCTVLVCAIRYVLLWRW